jgi:hypothetical protein
MLVTQNLQAEQQRRQLQQSGDQFGAGLQRDLGLQGLGTTLQAGQATSALGRDQQLANLERLKAQAATANEQQALDQEIANIKYQQFREEQDYGRKLLRVSIKYTSWYCRCIRLVLKCNTLQLLV